MSHTTQGLGSVKVTTIGQKIAEELLGPTQWDSPIRGYAPCPGLALHTVKSADEVLVRLDGVPTVFCFHQHCGEEINEINRALRSCFRRAQNQDGIPSASLQQDVLQRQQQSLDLKLKVTAWQRDLQMALAHLRHPRELTEASPSRLPEFVAQDRWQILRLFDRHDLIWTGDTCDSSRWDFATRSERITRRQCKGPLVCPNAFILNADARTKGNIKARRFLIVESDDLSIRQQTALIFHLAKQWPLAAVVHSGNHSLHAWFRWQPTWESSVAQQELKRYLATLHCDPSSVSSVQLCRLPGVLRPDTRKWQALLYLNLAYRYA